MAKMNKKQKINVIILISIVLLIFVLAKSVKQDNAEPVKIIEGSWDISEEVEAEGFTQFLVEEEDFDYSHPLIFQTAKELKLKSDSPEQTIRDSIKLVADEITYTSQVTIADCYDEKASDVVISGKGDCVSMARLVVSLLRAQGIPARTMGGCLSSSKRCGPIFAAVPGLEAQTTPLEEGDFKKRGFLHEWVHAWTPSEGWMIIEPTSGQIFPTDCMAYLNFKFDSNRFNRCVINSNAFWQECKVF